MYDSWPEKRRLSGTCLLEDLAIPLLKLKDSFHTLPIGTDFEMHISKTNMYSSADKWKLLTQRKQIT